MSAGIAARIALDGNGSVRGSEKENSFPLEGEVRVGGCSVQETGVIPLRVFP